MGTAMTDQPLHSEVDSQQERRRRGLLWLWLAVVVVLLAGLLTAIERLNGCSSTTCGPNAASGGTRHGGGASPTDSPRSGHSTGQHRADASPISIRVSGKERGNLAPGITRPVVVTVRNTGTTPARITSADVLVGDASKSCAAAPSIRVTRYNAIRAGAATYDLIPGSAIRIPLKISMLDLTTNQNACKNARFPLTFHATAQQG
jgi:hypothetical protein